MLIDALNAGYEELNSTKKDEVTDTDVYKLCLKQLLAMTKLGFTLGDEAVISVVNDAKHDMAAFMASLDMHALDISELVTRVLKDFSNYLISPSFYEGLPDRPDFIQRLIRNSPFISNPIEFVRNTALTSLSLGKAVAEQAVITQIGMRDFLGFSNRDVALMVASGAKVFGEHDESFLGWRQLDARISYSPLFTGLNRLPVIKHKASFFKVDHDTSTGDWQELVAYDKARHDSGLYSDFEKLTEHLSPFFAERLKLLGLTGSSGDDQNKLERIVTTILHGKPLSEYTTITNRFAEANSFLMISSLLLHVDEPALQLQEHTESMAATAHLTQVANHVKFHLDLYVAISNLCDSYCKSSLTASELLSEGRQLVSLLNTYVFEDAFNQNAIRAMPCDKVGELMAHTYNCALDYSPEEASSLLEAFIASWGIQGMQAILKKQHPEIVKMVIDELKNDGQRSFHLANAMNLYESSTVLGDLLGVIELAKPGSIKDINIDNIAKRYCCHAPTVLQTFAKRFEQSKIAQIDSDRIENDELNALFGSAMKI